MAYVILVDGHYGSSYLKSKVCPQTCQKLFCELILVKAKLIIRILTRTVRGWCNSVSIVLLVPLATHNQVSGTAKHVFSRDNKNITRTLSRIPITPWNVSSFVLCSYLIHSSFIHSFRWYVVPSQYQTPISMLVPHTFHLFPT